MGAMMETCHSTIPESQNQRPSLRLLTFHSTIHLGRGRQECLMKNFLRTKNSLTFIKTREPYNGIAKVRWRKVDSAAAIESNDSHDLC